MSDNYLKMYPEGKDFRVYLYLNGVERASTLFCWYEMDLLPGWMEGMIDVFKKAEEESGVQGPESESSCHTQGQEEGSEEEGGE